MTFKRNNRLKPLFINEILNYLIISTHYVVDSSPCWSPI